MKGRSRTVALLILAVVVVAVVILALTRPKGSRREQIKVSPGMGAEKGTVAGIDLEQLLTALKNINSTLADIVRKETESAVSVTIARNPMRPVPSVPVGTSILRGGGPVRPQSEIVFQPMFTASGVLYDETKPFAIVDGEVRTVGEAVAGWRIVKIAPDFVDVERDRRLFRLSVKTQTVEEIHQAPSKVVLKPDGTKAPAYSIQIAAVSSVGLEQLKKTADRLSRQGIPGVRIVRLGSHYVLRAGRCAERKEAEKILASLRGQFTTAYVVTVGEEEQTVYPEARENKEKQATQPERPAPQVVSLPSDIAEVQVPDDFSVMVWAAEEQQEGRSDNSAAVLADTSASSTTLASCDVPAKNPPDSVQPEARYAKEIERNADWLLFALPESLRWSPHYEVASRTFSESAVFSDAGAG